ncbi:early activation antigen CD69-like isoform X1 [Chiroxiphia lanceolata]|uniref:early activation antigen CD69-like isoform X1 n=1 Tax=Chiroxiphia lanceolata TaxID=296741 RepID=UPI0013CE9E91|nr:early activation antigen CD69-like isoform X1 [Chiroxiphia lanceolata]
MTKPTLPRNLPVAESCPVSLLLLTELLLGKRNEKVVVKRAMAQVQDGACPGQEGASSKFAGIQDMEGERNWNGENAEEPLSHQDGSETRKTLRKHLGNWFRSRRVLTVLLVLSVLLNVVAVAVLAGKSHGEIPVTPKGPQFVACPEDWIGYNRVCYYLSREEGTWEQARDRCSELGASLAVLSDKAMGFLFRLNGNLDYWLGLRRRGERFQWVDGSSYNSSVPVLGDSECVYLGHRRFRSGVCSAQRPYLCNRPQDRLQ